MARFPNCSAALEALAKGLDPETCHSFRDVRRIAMCVAWHKTKGEPLTPEAFESRVQAGWNEVRKACERHGGIRPEVGFLTPGQVTKSLPEEAFAQAVNTKEIKQGGERVGIFVEMADGSGIICLQDRCEVVKKGETLENVEALLSIYGLDLT